MATVLMVDSEPARPRRTVPRALKLSLAGVGLLIGIGVLGALTLGGSSAASTCGGAATRPDRPAPDIAGRNVADGTPLRYEPGAITVVNVWGSWCGPCRLEQPMLVRAAGRFPEVRFLGLDVQDNDAAARAFQEEFSVPYPSIADPSREVSARLGAVVTPATFVIDAKGVVRAQAMGAVHVDTLDCMISLARPTPAPGG